MQRTSGFVSRSKPLSTERLRFGCSDTGDARLHRGTPIWEASAPRCECYLTEWAPHPILNPGSASAQRSVKSRLRNH